MIKESQSRKRQMGLSAKSIEIIAQLFETSRISEADNMQRFLRAYEYPRDIISYFDTSVAYPIGSMPWDEYVEWGSTVIRRISAARGPTNELFIKLATDFLNEIQDNVLGLGYTELSSGGDVQRLRRRLELDGYKYESGTLVPIEHSSAVIQQSKTLLESMIGRNSELTTEVLTEHLRQCEDNYQIGHWKDSVAQARNLVEQVLRDIAEASAAAREESPDLSKPRKVRDYLTQAGFLAPKEREKLVDGVYGHLSEEGSHPGIADDKVARISRVMMISFGYYLLEKFETWKANNFLDL